MDAINFTKKLLGDVTITNCLYNFEYLINQTVEIELFSGKSLRCTIIDYNSDKSRPEFFAVFDLKAEVIKFINVKHVETISFVEEKLKAFL